MTNIQYYARAQKQDKTFHSRAKAKKKPNSSEGFLERRGMTASYYIATCTAIKSERVAKRTQREKSDEDPL